MGVVVWGGFFITTPPSALGRNSSERADANGPCCSIRRPSNLSSPNAKDNYYESSSLYSPNSSTFISNTKYVSTTQLHQEIREAGFVVKSLIERTPSL